MRLSGNGWRFSPGRARPTEVGTRQVRWMGLCLTGALRRVAPGLLTLVDYLLGNLHVWIREWSNNLTLSLW